MRARRFASTSGSYKIHFWPRRLIITTVARCFALLIFSRRGIEMRVLVGLPCGVFLESDFIFCVGVSASEGSLSISSAAAAVGKNAVLAGARSRSPAPRADGV
jgi:hypothetical protein